MIYCEGTNDKAKDEAGGSQEKLVNRGGIVLVKGLASARAQTYVRACSPALRSSCGVTTRMHAQR